MSTSAPRTRIVDALSGDVADSPVLGILATADHISDGLADAERLHDENAELRCRVDELELELAEAQERNMALVRRIAELRRQLETWRQSALAATRELEWEQSC